MASTVSNHSSEEVGKELKSEAKIMEPVQVSPPKESVHSPEPEEVPAPVATFTESGAKIEETETEPIVTENIKEIDTDENPKAEESCVLAEESEQKIEDKHAEVPLGEEEKKIEDACDKNNTEVEKVSDPEPDIKLVSEEPVVEKIESESVENLDTKTVEKQEESKVEPCVVEKIGEPEKVVKVSEPLSAQVAPEEYVQNVEELPAKDVEDSEPELAKVETAEEKKDETAKIINVGEQSSIKGVEEKEEIDDKSPGIEVEASEEKEVKDAESKPEETLEAEPAEKLEQSTVESVEEKPEEPGETVQVPLQYSVDNVKVETAEEKKDEIAKTINVGKQSSKEAVEEKVENVDKNPGKEVEASKEKEVKGAESKPEEISKTEPAEKLEQSSVESVEENGEEPRETSQVPIQSSVDPVEEKVENLEDLPVKEVEAIVEKEGTVSKAEAAEKQDEFIVEPADEKVNESTKTAEQSSVEAIEENVKKPSPAKYVEETADKEVNVSGTEIEPEETSETKSVESVEKTSVEPAKIVDEPEQSSVEEKVEELPSKDVVGKEAMVSESGCQNEEILGADPSGNLVESKVELAEEKPVESKEIVEAVEEEDKSIEKVEELPAKIMEEIQEAKAKEAENLEAGLKPEEISETKPVEETSVESEKIADLPVQTSVIEKLGEAEELPAKEVEVIEDKEPEEVSGREPAEKLEESEVALVEEKSDESIKIADVIEQLYDDVAQSPAKIVEEIQERTDKEAKFSEAEPKAEEISETKPVEETPAESEKIVDVPVKASVLEKLGEAEELPVKEVEAIEDKEPEDISRTEPAENLEESKVALVEEKPNESIKIVDVIEQSPTEIDKGKVEKGEEFPAKESEPILEKENVVPEAEFKHEETSETELAEKQDKSKLELVEDNLNESTQIVNVLEVGIMEELPAKEVDATAEEAVKVSGDENKPEELSETETIEKNPVETEKLVDVAEQSWVESVEEKLEKIEELPVKNVVATVGKEVEVLEPDRKLEGTSESALEKKLVERSEKDPPAAEPVEKVKVEALVDKVEETELSNEEEQTILKNRVDGVSEKTDAANEQKESVKKIVEIDPLPEEKAVDSGKVELETEAQVGKSVTTKELPPCEEENPTESEATEKPVKEEVASRDVELLPENGNTKDEADIEGNGDEEATKESEKSEPATQIENIGRSLEEKLEQEKRDDETTKTKVQVDTTNESEDTKAAEDESKEEVSVKTTQKQSNNIMKMVKHSLVKAKKAIIGKSANSKAPVSEVKGDGVKK